MINLYALNKLMTLKKSFLCTRIKVYFIKQANFSGVHQLLLKIILIGLFLFLL